MNFYKTRPCRITSFVRPICYPCAMQRRIQFLLFYEVSPSLIGENDTRVVREGLVGCHKGPNRIFLRKYKLLVVL